MHRVDNLELNHNVSMLMQQLKNTWQKWKKKK